MKYLCMLTIAMSFLLGCSNESAQKTEKSAAMIDVPVTIDKIEVGNIDDVKTVAELEIEGMTVAIGNNDPDKINEHEADGQHKVEKIVFSKNLEKEEIEKNQTSMVDVKFSFPNILDIFTLVLR